MSRPVDPVTADRDLGSLPWTEIESVLRAADRVVALLPVGATEPHGPHLPLETDVIISVETARRAAERLRRRGVEPLVLPPFAYSVTDYSRDFAGAIGIAQGTSVTLVRDICASALAHGFAALAMVNSHLEPDHLEALREAAALAESETGRPVILPEVTGRRWAMQLTEEFRSGACHAGRYETSLVMACRPDLVDETTRRTLPAVPISIGRKIKEGARSFREAGGDRAYFGDPAAASAEEGEAIYETLASMVETEVMERLG